MDKNKEQKEQLPDFDSLDDRIIAEPSTSPRIVAETNLDVKSNKEKNPYASTENKNDISERLFNEFFSE